MSNLVILDLMGNSISGTMPTLPSSLVFVDVEGNELTGRPFDNFEQLSNLQKFHVSSNSFTGPIPTSLPPNLEELWMANNRISGSIPAAIGDLSELRKYLKGSANMLCPFLFLSLHSSLLCLCFALLFAHCRIVVHLQQ